MPKNAFISYSHSDRDELNNLHNHLAMLRRENILNAWTDHQIIPGDLVDDIITYNLENSSIFIAFVSASYLASGYCYNNEFERALSLQRNGRIRIVPVILRSCDWLSSPLRNFLALPSDGKPICNSPDRDSAYLNVVNGLRSVINALELTHDTRLPLLMDNREILLTINAEDARFGVELGFSLGRLECLNGSILPDAESVVSGIRIDICDILKRGNFSELLPYCNDKAQPLMERVIRYFFRCDIKKQAAVLIGIGVQRLSIAHGLSSPETKNDMRQLARSAFDGIDRDVCADPNVIFERVSQMNSYSIAETCRIIAAMR